MDDRQRRVGPVDEGRWRRVRELFLQLLEVAPEERLAWWLEVEQGNGPGTPVDTGLRSEVEAMLAAHGDPPRLQIEQLFQAHPESETVVEGLRIGAYQVIEEIGRGGMGTVYRAERVDDYRHLVALKVIRPGLQAFEIAARFRRERQILARLRHPNIAQLLDGGMTDDGRPFLVMPLIEGLPITDYCDRQALPISDRLKLFREVCQAVQYAHQNLVVHRDLKPSNILVSPDGQVHLLDFGIAKLLSSEEPELGLTRSQQRLMTPEHASPEQIRGQSITLATDTYGLGILLYELLTGRRPFTGAELSSAQLETAICEIEPAAPSSVVRPAGGGTDGAELAAARRLRPERWRRLLLGDLDTIVGQALRKDPERRYGTAEELSEDIRRHLEGEPVRARPDTIRYRAGRFVQRHRWGVVAVTALVLLGLAFTITTLLQSRALAEERDQARLERNSAEQVSGVLVELFELANPTQTPDGKSMRVDELLERYSDRVIDELADQPAVQARLRHVLGIAHRAHSQFESSRQLLGRALAQRRELGGADDLEGLSIAHDLAKLEAAAGDPEVAEDLLRQSLANHRRLLGMQGEAVAQCLQDLAMVLPATAEETSVLLEDALALRRELEPTPGLATASNLNSLAILRLEQSRPQEAVDLLGEARDLVEQELGDQHPFLLTLRGNLSSALLRMNRLDQAEAVERRLLAQKQGVYGEESTAAANSLNNLGATLATQGKLQEAESVLRQALDLWSRLVSEQHPQIASTNRNLARVIELQGRLEEALLLLQSSDRARGDLDRDPFLDVQLAGVLLHLGRVDESADSLAGVLATLAGPAESDYRLADTEILLAAARLAQGRLEEAAELFRHALLLRKSFLDPGHPRVAEAACGLARALEAQGLTAEADVLFSGCLSTLATWGLADPQWLEASRQAAKRAES